MKPMVKFVATGCLATLFCCGTVLYSAPAFGAFMFKKYAVKYDRGYDILCEPYVVKKNDWILKVFKRKGEIAYRNFREFLKIFERINPHVKNVNQIRPGQYVLIPLRRIPLDSLPGQSTGTVTIPFVTLSNFPESIANSTMDYVINKGDTVSELISREFGAYGTTAYLRGIELFRDLNPEVIDLNLIYFGRKLVLPSRKFQGNALASRTSGRETSFWNKGPSEAISSKKSIRRNNNKKPDTSIAEAAAILGAKLLNSGAYYFPGSTGIESTLDLSKFPVMVFKNDTRILFRGDNASGTAAIKSAAFFWKKLKYADISPRNSTEKIISSVMDILKIEPSRKTLQFYDHGITVAVKGKWIVNASQMGEDKMQRLCISIIDNPGERTHHSIIRYLEQHGILLREVVRETGEEKTLPNGTDPLNTEYKAIILPTENSRGFVKSFMDIIGCPYAQNVIITFPYAGIEVKAVSNLISARDGTPVFVAFGDLYGDAVDEILKTGFSIIQVLPEDDLGEAVPKLLDAAGAVFIKNPTLLAAERDHEYNTSLTLPGYMVEKFGNPAILLTKFSLPNELLHFLLEKTIRPVKIGPISK